MDTIRGVQAEDGCTGAAAPSGESGSCGTVAGALNIGPSEYGGSGWAVRTSAPAEALPRASTDEGLRGMLRASPSKRGFSPLLSVPSTFRRAARRSRAAAASDSRTAAPAVGDDENRRLRRVPNRLRRLYVVFVTLLALCIFFTAVQEAWLWVFSTPEGCDLADDRAEECDPSGVVVMLVVGKQVIHQTHPLIPLPQPTFNPTRNECICANPAPITHREVNNGAYTTLNKAGGQVTRPPLHHVKSSHKQLASAPLCALPSLQSLP
jgi:hypothetical protein